MRSRPPGYRSVRSIPYQLLMLFHSSLSICQLAYPQVQLRKARVLQEFTAPRKIRSVFGSGMRSAWRVRAPRCPGWSSGALLLHYISTGLHLCVCKDVGSPRAEKQGLPLGKLLWTERDAETPQVPQGWASRAPHCPQGCDSPRFRVRRATLPTEMLILNTRQKG